MKGYMMSWPVFFFRFGREKYSKGREVGGEGEGSGGKGGGKRGLGTPLPTPTIYKTFNTEMKQDENSTARPKTDHQAPTNLNILGRILN